MKKQEDAEANIGDFIVTNENFTVLSKDKKRVVKKAGFSGIILFKEKNSSNETVYGILFGDGLNWCFNLKNQLTNPSGCWLKRSQFLLD